MEMKFVIVVPHPHHIHTEKENGHAYNEPHFSNVVSRIIFFIPLHSDFNFFIYVNIRFHCFSLLP